jgi:alpha-beta hydrolase superfamily lysophospholipase
LFSSALEHGQLEPSLEDWRYVAAANGGLSVPVPTAARGYAAAPAQFHTRLIKHGPAPQAWRPYSMPDDAYTVDYTSSGLQLRAWLSHSADSTPHPAVLLVHGGAAFDTDDWRTSQPLRDAGFIVMTPILRGEGDQPGDYSMFYDEVDDVFAAAEVLARQPGVDPRQIYLAGYSAGGSLALLAALASQRFRAVAPVVRLTRPRVADRTPRLRSDRAVRTRQCRGRTHAIGARVRRQLLVPGTGVLGQRPARGRR